MRHAAHKGLWSLLVGLCICSSSSSGEGAFAVIMLLKASIYTVRRQLGPFASWQVPRKAELWVDSELALVTSLPYCPDLDGTRFRCKTCNHYELKHTFVPRSLNSSRFICSHSHGKGLDLALSLQILQNHCIDSLMTHPDIAWNRSCHPPMLLGCQAGDLC